MAKPNKNNADTTTLPGRLAFCMANAGGKKQLAAATGISEAQLFRYMNTISDMPVSKLVAISQASGMDAGWLLTGEAASAVADTAPKTPPFRPALMQYVARMLDEFLVEYQKPIPPRLKSGLLTLIYEALRHKEFSRGQNVQLNKFEFLEILNFFSSFRSEEEIDVYREAMGLMENNPEAIEDSFIFRTFESLIARGYTAYYDSFSGQAYYDRVGSSLWESSEKELSDFIQRGLDTFQRSDLALLDLGCGNGRAMTFVHQKFPKISLSGTDVSQRAVDLCKALERSGKLPDQTVTVAGCSSLPFSDDSLELIYCRNTLQMLPNLGNTPLGLHRALAEMQRVLKRNGLACLIVPQAQTRDYSVFAECITREMLETLASQLKFKILDYKSADFYSPQLAKGMAQCMPDFLLSHHLIIQKL